MKKLSILIVLLMSVTAFGWGRRSYTQPDFDDLDIDDDAITSAMMEMKPMWMDDYRSRQRFMRGAVVYDGELYSWNHENIDNVGIWIYDGKTVRRGAKFSDTSPALTQMWGIDDVGLFVHTLDGSTEAIEKTTDGDTDFVDATPGTLPTGGTTLARSLIDCGTQTISGTEKRVLLYAEYGADETTNIWYSAEIADVNAGNSGTWTELFAENADIKHFHGGRYVDGVGLYIFTGDSNIDSSILFCDDVNSLINEPNTWDDRWGIAQGDRDNAGSWADVPYDADYVVGGGDQSWRTVELINHNDQYGYYMPDTSPDADNGQDIYKIDFSDNSRTLAAENVCNGFGWYGGYHGDSNTVILTSASYYNSGFPTGNDEYVYMVLLNPDDDSYAVRKYPRGDYDASRSVVPPTANAKFVTGLVDYDDRIWGVIDQGKPYNLLAVADGKQTIVGTPYTQEDMYDVVKWSSSHYYAPYPAWNLINNGTFWNEDTGWTAANSNIADVNSPAYGGLGKSLQISATTNGTEGDYPGARVMWNDGTLEKQVGMSMLTASAMFYIEDTNSSADVVPGLQLGFGTHSVYVWSKDPPRDQWFELSASGLSLNAYDIAGAQGVWVWGHDDGSDGKDIEVYISDVRCVQGCLPGPLRTLERDAYQQ